VPNVTVLDYEIRADLVPPLCLKCGDPATVRVEKNFSWYPRWIYVFFLLGLPGMLLMVILAFALKKRKLLHAPMCDKHCNLWKNGTWTILGSLFGLVTVAILLTIFGTQIDTIPGWRGYSFVVIFGGWITAIVLWLIVVGVLNSLSVSPTSITDDGITLSGVSARFVDALESERDESAREMKADRLRRHRTMDDFDDQPPLPPTPSDDRIRKRID
jgi:hypothetical protein